MHSKKVLMVFFFAAFSMSSVFAQRPQPKKTEILGHTMYTLLKPGDIRSEEHTSELSHIPLSRMPSSA